MTMISNFPPISIEQLWQDTNFFTMPQESACQNISCTLILYWVFWFLVTTFVNDAYVLILREQYKVRQFMWTEQRYTKTPIHYL